MKNNNIKNTRFIRIIFVAITLSLSLFSCTNKPKLESIRDDDVSNRASFSKNVIYQIVTDRFWDGNKDNNPSGEIFDKNDLKKYHGGDWQGIIDKINDGYFKDLGVSALWISSPVENIMTIDPSNGASSYHAYWAKDFFRTNPAFGSIEDFKTLIKTAHENNIKVIIDFAPNHTSTAEFEGVTFPEDGALYRDGELVGTYSNDEKNYFNHEGLINNNDYENGIYRSLFGLADLNNINPEIDTYLKEAIDKWLELGIDGIRVDAVKHNSLGWQKNWLSHIYEKNDIFVFGEWFANGSGSDSKMTKFINSSGMSLLDFRFAHSVRSLFSDNEFTMDNFYEMIDESNKDYTSVYDQVTFIDNHDIARFMNVVGGDKRALELAEVLLLTSRGVPAIYYGTEHYMTGEKDPENRADMPSFDSSSKAHKIITALSKLRRENNSLAYGSTQKLWSNDDAIVFERAFGDDVVLVALNRSKEKTYETGEIITKLAKDNKYSDLLETILDESSKNNYISVNSDGKIENIHLDAQSAIVLAYDLEASNSPIIGDFGPVIALKDNKIGISGDGFGEKAGKAFIGETEAKLVSWSDSFVEVKVPEMKSGKYTVKIQNKKGEFSNELGELEIFSKKQAPLRIILNNVDAKRGKKLYLMMSEEKIDASLVGNEAKKDELIGPFFNSTKTIAVDPSFFYDLNIPQESDLFFKFLVVDPYGMVTAETKTYEHKSGTQSETIEFDWE